MTLAKSRRLNLIKRIAAELADAKLPEIELTLDTFGVPDLYHWENWSDAREYAIRRLRRARDDTLVETHAHLYADIGVSLVAGGPWEEGRFRLFLSHTSAHKALAKEIRHALRPFGIDTFVAHEDIAPTMAWEREIEIALGTCDAMLVLNTPDFIASEYCDQEVGFAMGRDLLLIVVMQGAKPHGFINKWQGLPGEEGDGAAVRLATPIYAILTEHEKSRAKMATATVNRYTRSASYKNARLNAQRLMKIPKELWTDAMVDEAERAGIENNQVAEAFWGSGHVPGAVSRHLDELLERRGEPRGVPATDGGHDDMPF